MSRCLLDLTCANHTLLARRKHFSASVELPMIDRGEAGLRAGRWQPGHAMHLSQSDVSGVLGGFGTFVYDFLPILTLGFELD